MCYVIDVNGVGDSDRAVGRIGSMNKTPRRKIKSNFTTTPKQEGSRVEGFLGLATRPT